MTFGRDNCQLAGAPLPTRAAPPATLPLSPPPGSCHEGSGLRYYRPLRSCHLALGNVWSGADSANYRLATPAPRSGDGTFFLDILYCGNILPVKKKTGCRKPNRHERVCFGNQICWKPKVPPCSDMELLHFRCKKRGKSGVGSNFCFGG